jgi:hypothetical protein
VLTRYRTIEAPPVLHFRLVDFWVRSSILYPDREYEGLGSVLEGDVRVERLHSHSLRLWRPRGEIHLDRVVGIIPPTRCHTPDPDIVDLLYLAHQSAGNRSLRRELFTVEKYLGDITTTRFKLDTGSGFEST